MPPGTGGEQLKHGLLLLEGNRPVGGEVMAARETGVAREEKKEGANELSGDHILSR